MNILIFSWRGPGHPYAGGAELVSHEHAKSWIKKGHSVTLFTSYFKGAKQEEHLDDVKIIRSGHAILMVQIRAFFWYLLINKERFDVVVDEFHGLPFFTPIFVRSKKIAWIHEIAGNVWKYNWLPFPINLIVSLFGPTCELLIFKLFYKNTPFLTFANSIKNDLIEVGIAGKNIKVINHGVNILKSKKNKNKTFTVIFLGVLARDKGIEDALLAVKLLKDKVKDLKFWIIGKGEPSYTTYLKSKVSSLGIKNITYFWGFVDNRKKFDLLKKSSVLIHPSLREGWGLVVIEAAAMGTPTVGYNISGLKDSILNNKTGLLCRENNPKDLFKNIMLLYENDSLYKKLSSNCLSWSKNFSWDKSTNKSLNLISNL